MYARRMSPGHSSLITGLGIITCSVHVNKTSRWDVGYNMAADRPAKCCVNSGRLPDGTRHKWDTRCTTLYRGVYLKHRDKYSTQQCSHLKPWP